MVINSREVGCNLMRSGPGSGRWFLGFIFRASSNNNNIINKNLGLFFAELPRYRHWCGRSCINNNSIGIEHRCREVYLVYKKPLKNTTEKSFSTKRYYQVNSKEEEGPKIKIMLLITTI